MWRVDWSQLINWIAVGLIGLMFSILLYGFKKYMDGRIDRKKRRDEIDLKFKQRVAAVEHQRRTKQEKAVPKRDAIAFVDAQREYEREMKLAEQQRDLEIADLEKDGQSQ